MRLKQILTLFLLCSCVKQAPDAPVVTPTAIPFNANISTGTLENGLTFFVNQNTEPEGWAEFWLFVKAGSLQEEDDQRGLAHLLEHMAFNGTENFNGQELIAAIEATGASFGAHLNAHTSFDETIYKLRVPTDNPETVDQALLILRDWATGLTLDTNEIDKERGVVLDEYRRRLGAGYRLGLVSYPLIYGTKYAERLPIGTEESLNTFKTEAVRRFYTDWYRPDLMAVAAVGDFDPDIIQQKIIAQFSPITNPETSRALAQYEPEPFEADQVLLQSDPELTRSGVQIIARTPWSWSDTEASYRQRMVERLFYSLLNQRFAMIQRQAEAPFIRASAYRRSITTKTSNIQVSVGTHPGQLNHGLLAALTEVERVRQHGFTSSELQRETAKQQRSFDSMLKEQENTSSSAKVNELKRHFIEGETVPGIEKEHQLVTRFLPTITLSELNEFAKNWMDGSEHLIMAQQTEKEQTAEPLTGSVLLQTLANARGAELQPYTEEVVPDTLLEELPTPGQIVKEIDHPEIGVTEWTLSNGMRVLLRPSTFREDEVVFSIQGWGGTSTSNDEGYVPARLAATAAVTSGLGLLNRTQLDHFLSGKKVSVRPGIGRYQQQITGRFSPQDQTTAFEIIHSWFTQPRFDQGLINNYLSKAKNTANNRDASPVNRYRDRKTALVYNQHPRRMPWTAEHYDKFELNTAQSWFSERFSRPGDMIGVFTGTFEKDELRPFVERYLASLSNTGTATAWSDENAPKTTGILKETVQAGSEDKATVEIEFHGPREWNPQTGTFRRALVHALKKKLRMALREDNSGTYGVGVSSSHSQIPKEQYSLRLSFTCESARVEELTRILFEELNDIIKHPVDAETVKTIQTKMYKTHETRLKTNKYWQSTLQWRANYSMPLDGVLQHNEYVEQITAEVIQEEAKALLNMQQYTHFVHIPEHPGDGKHEDVP